MAGDALLEKKLEVFPCGHLCLTGREIEDFGPASPADKTSHCRSVPLHYGIGELAVKKPGKRHNRT